jgi:hypothetical protein
MKRLIVSLVLLVVLALPGQALAQEQVCTSVYGGGVVCGARHEVVDTGIAENIALVGALSMGASGVLLFLSKRAKTLS